MKPDATFTIEFFQRSLDLPLTLEHGGNQADPIVQCIVLQGFDGPEIRVGESVVVTSFKFEFGFDLVILVTVRMTVIVPQIANFREKRINEALFQVLSFIGINDGVLISFNGGGSVCQYHSVHHLGADGSLTVPPQMPERFDFRRRVAVG